ncbi:hypothetical protein NEMBOFW57_006249 [Staphylotrichum longicolle]|uniref:Uncharacterized protein n=1 Tax=Staphylotrichum longicolle TaxID=669026 RepID=A0AAD4EYK1_9PEZI|nr:hypothetical protein NEMBOFW57_006249 [Staphylotrichum longicolle]
MTPNRRNRGAAKSDVGGYQATDSWRNSARIGELAVEQEAGADEEQADHPVRPKQEVHEGQPGHPMPFPLRLNSYYVSTGSGSLFLEDVEVAKVKTTGEEKEHVIYALGLILQAFRALTLEAMPDSLDRNHDIVWDWRSVELSANEYGAFAYAMVNYLELKHAMDIVSYDWTPLDSHKGVLSVRKKCRFQSELTRILTGVIINALYDNELLRSLVDCVELEPQIQASVLTGTVEGIRMPCRCFRFKPKSKSEKEEEEEARPVDGIQDFVLEVGMGQKTQVLCELAQSYIERGTLCVMTVSVERQGEFDFDWSFSLYRRGEARPLPGEVTRYEAVCTMQDARVKADQNGVQFPAGLTLFDFVPSSILNRNGVTGWDDKKAVLELCMGSDDLDLMKRNPIGYFENGKSISQHLQNLGELLRT